MIICSKCLGKKCIEHGNVIIPCIECKERGYKEIGENLYSDKDEFSYNNY